MPGNPIQIGPFTKGLNNTSTAGEAMDTEVVELVNFELTTDTALTSRPPMEVFSSVLNESPENWDIMGLYRVTPDDWYVIYVKPIGNGQFSIVSALKGDPNNAETIYSMTGVENIPSAMVQVSDWLYFCRKPESSSGQVGLKWKKGSAYVALSQMPRGNSMIAHKARLWIAGSGNSANNSRIWCSFLDKVGPNFDRWEQAVDFFDVAPGEGGFITALLPLNSYILIFKDDGTWRYSYPAAPKDGQVDKVSGTIGTPNPYSVVEYENYVYVWDQGKLYELVNNNYTWINPNLEFKLDPNAVDAFVGGVEMSVVDKRLIIRYFNTIYVYLLESRTWSMWHTQCGTPGRFFELLGQSETALPRQYVAASRGNMQAQSINLIPDPNNIDEKLFAKRAAFTANTSDIVLNPDKSVTITAKSGSAWGTFGLNSTGQVTNTIQDATLPVAQNQRYRFTAKVTNAVSSVANAVRVIARIIKNDGTYTHLWQEYTAAQAANLVFDFTIPSGGISMLIEIRQATGTQPGDTFTFSAPNLVRRGNVRAAQNIIKLTEKFESVLPTEFQVCKVRTKAYDYRAPSVFKRLFWYGLDVKTTLLVNAKVIPVARRMQVTHNDLKQYTHAQLSQGTWGNPLSWLTVDLSVSDPTDPVNAMTENGRLFIKNERSLRFRQTSFEIEMITHGSKATGPAKLFSLTTYVKPKETVTGKAN